MLKAQNYETMSCKILCYNRPVCDRNVSAARVSVVKNTPFFGVKFCYSKFLKKIFFAKNPYGVRKWQSVFYCFSKTRNRKLEIETQNRVFAFEFSLLSFRFRVFDCKKIKKKYLKNIYENIKKTISKNYTSYPGQKFAYPYTYPYTRYAEFSVSVFFTTLTRVNFIFRKMDQRIWTTAFL